MHIKLLTLSLGFKTKVLLKVLCLPLKVEESFFVVVVHFLNENRTHYFYPLSKKLQTPLSTKINNKDRKG